MFKVDPPNYDFSLNSFDSFTPGKKITEAEGKFSKGEVMSEKGGIQTQKFFVAHIRYKFPVMVQVRDGEVLDFFARLPSYFLHDLFFQSLVNKMGKQTSYKKVLEEAVYVWEKDGMKHVYSAACTITCFPIFYSVSPLKETSPSILNQMVIKKK